MSYRPEDTHILDTVQVDTDTFQVFVDKVNLIVDHLRHTVVTVSNTASYQGNNAGNGYVTGIFGGNTIVVGNTLRGGNVTNHSNLSIASITTVSNNLLVGGTFTVTGSGLSNVNSINIRGTANVAAALNVVGRGTFTANAEFKNDIEVAGTVHIANIAAQKAFANNSLGANITAPQVVFSWPKANWTTGRVILQTKAGANVQSFESVIVHNGTVASQQVYGVASAPAGANNGVFTVGANTTHVLLQFTQRVINTAVSGTINLVK